MAHIRILGTGATIASTAGDDGAAVAAGVEPGTREDPDLGLLGRHQVTTRQVGTAGRIPRLGDLRRVVLAIVNALADPQIDGVVVTYPSAAITEAAFLMDLVQVSPKPVVFTGARRPPGRVGADGLRNLSEAVEAAAALSLRGAGTLIAMAGTVRTARGAEMSGSGAAPMTGGTVVGHFLGDRLHVSARPVRGAPLPLPPEEFDLARVDIIGCPLGADTGLLRQAISAADAVVLTGSQLSEPPEDLLDAVQDSVSRGCPVMLSSWCRDGAVLTGFGEAVAPELLAAGGIPSGELHAAQVRMLAALLTSVPAGHEDIRRALTTGSEPLTRAEA